MRPRTASGGILRERPPGTLANYRLNADPVEIRNRALFGILVIFLRRELVRDQNVNLAAGQATHPPPDRPVVRLAVVHPRRDSFADLAQHFPVCRSAAPAGAIRQRTDDNRRRVVRRPRRPPPFLSASTSNTHRVNPFKDRRPCPAVASTWPSASPSPATWPSSAAERPAGPGWRLASRPQPQTYRARRDSGWCRS